MLCIKSCISYANVRMAVCMDTSIVRMALDLYNIKINGIGGHIFPHGIT